MLRRYIMAHSGCMLYDVYDQLLVDKNLQIIRFHLRKYINMCTKIPNDPDLNFSVCRDCTELVAQRNLFCGRSLLFTVLIKNY